MTNAPTPPARTGVARQVLTLVSGTLLAQAIAFVAQIGVARLYTDADLGYLGLFTSAAALGAAVAGVRFDLSIVLPSPGDEASARSLFRLSSRCVLVASALATLVAACARPWVSVRYGEALAGWMLAAGISILFLAQGQVCSYWLTRHRRFRVLASSSVVRSLGIAALQLVCGALASGGLGAAIGATLAGQGIAVAYLSWCVRDARVGEASDPSLREVASRYRKMALVGVPNVVVDALRTSAIPMLIASYSVASLGQFNMAWMVLQAPVALIAGALSQVYLPRLSDTPAGEMTRVVCRVGAMALGASIPVFALIAGISPWLFPFVFGGRWGEAGYFARSLAPWLALTVATSPLSNVFVATYHQRRMLAFACVYCAAPLAWLAVSPYGIETTMSVLGALMAVLLTVMLVMAVVTARSYDRGRRA
ncbi:lipopolysaccharide biosynthesis protein [Actinomyces bouchesdurhonensis]|uniref:lipopolysaccharide biosynthesis protein n=1 Tax=Actinomyces bouchesdurhonensis TaxID=1852361 RepID=UPI003C76B251